MLDASLVLDELFNIIVIFFIRHRVDAHNIAVGLNLAIFAWYPVILPLVMVSPMFTVDKGKVLALSAVVPGLTFLLCCLVFGKEIPHRRVI